MSEKGGRKEKCKNPSNLLLLFPSVCILFKTLLRFSWLYMLKPRCYNKLSTCIGPFLVSYAFFAANRTEPTDVLSIDPKPLYLAAKNLLLHQ